MNAFHLKKLHGDYQSMIWDQLCKIFSFNGEIYTINELELASLEKLSAIESMLRTARFTRYR